jgi:hypothetical protein
MAKTVHDDVLDGALAIIRGNCNLMVACSAQPTTRAEAVTTYALADVAMTPTTDFTISDGDVSGRKVRTAAKSGVTVDANGTATYIALVDGTRLLAVTTCTSQVLTAGNTVDFPAFDFEIADPT